MGWDFLGRGLSDLGSKLWSTAKLAVPAYAIFEFLRWLVTSLFTSSVDWAMAKVDSVIANLQVDLAIPASPWISKVNSVFPLEEAFHYLLLYLGIASAIIGIKWFRNLVPGFK